jgi:DNA primase
MMADKSLKQVLDEVFPLISVKKILDYYSVNYTPRGDEYVTNCVFHERYRGKVDKNPSLNINSKKKLFNCFSCPAKGNIYQLVMQLELDSGKKSCSFSDAFKKICEIHNIAIDGVFKIDKDSFVDDMSIDEIVDGDERIVEVFNDSVLNKFYLKKHNYFIDRGFLPDTLKYFEMGFGTKNLDKDRCIFPVRNSYGGLVGWTGRSVIKTVKPKWLHRPKDRFFTSLNLFNIDKALKSILDTDTVYVVESVANCMRMYEAGFKNCVAILGMNMSETQANMLCEYASHIVLLYDNDDAGRDGVGLAVDLLYDKGVRVSIGQYDFGKDEKGYAYDIGDVSVDDILSKISYIDMNEYLERHGGLMKLLDNIDLEEPIAITTGDGETVIVCEKLDGDCEYPQLCLDDILYIKRINNMFTIRGIDVNPVKPF